MLRIVSHRVLRNGSAISTCRFRAARSTGNDIIRIKHHTFGASHNSSVHPSSVRCMSTSSSSTTLSSSPEVASDNDEVLLYSSVDGSRGRMLEIVQRGIASAALVSGGVALLAFVPSLPEWYATVGVIAASAASLYTGYTIGMRTYGRWLYNERLRHYGVLRLSTIVRPKPELHIVTATETYKLPLLPGRRRQQLFPSPIQSSQRYNWGTFIRSGLGLRVDGDAGEFMLDVNGTVHVPHILADWIYGTRARALDRTGLLPLGHADRLSHHARWEVRLRGAPSVELATSQLLLFAYLPRVIDVERLTSDNIEAIVDESDDHIDDTMLIRRGVCHNCSGATTKSKQSSLAKGKLVQYSNELCIECPSCRQRLHPLLDTQSTLPLEEIDGVVYLRFAAPPDNTSTSSSSSSAAASTPPTSPSSSSSESLGAFFRHRDTIHEDGLVAMVPLSGDGGISRIVDHNDMITPTPTNAAVASEHRQKN